MALVLKMKYVSRFMLYVASFVVSIVILFVLNDTMFNVDELMLLAVAAVLALPETWGLAAILRT